MKDENTEIEQKNRTNDEHAKSPNRQTEGRMPTSRESVEDIVSVNRETFQTLASSDLPIAEDAQRALLMTDGGEDQ